MIDPPGHGKLVPTDRGYGECAAVTIVPQGHHPFAFPRTAISPAEQNRRLHGLVTVGKDIRLDSNIISSNSFYGIVRRFRLRNHAFDNGSFAALGR